MARLKSIVKTFEFEEKNRSLLTIGTNTRLVPEDSCIQLKLTNGGYSTDNDLKIETWAINPNSVKQWKGFDAEVTNTKNYDGTYLTSIGYRLSDDTNEYYWNGSAWVINTTDWNTENEVSSNIDEFSVSSKKLKIIINLKTTNSAYTPKVYFISVLYNSDVNFQDDIIFDSLIPELESDVQPISEYLVTLSADSNTIDLTNDFPLEAPYTITDIDSCFNHTDDPNHETDIFSSYNANTKVITLTTTILSGKKVWIRFIYQPIVSVSTDQEYLEIAEVPALHITGINTISDIKFNHPPAIRNKGDGTAVKLDEGRLRDIEITLLTVTGKQKDQQILQDEIRSFLVNNRFLTSYGIDEEYELLKTSDFSQNTIQQDKSPIYSGEIRFVIRKVIFLQRTARDLYTIQRFVLSGDLDVEIE